MSDQFTTYLHDIAVNTGYPMPARVLAQALLRQWQDGITPAPGTLQQLRGMLMPPEPCTRLAQDGACAWLRQYGEQHELSVPPVGERAICQFRGTFSKCPGYRTRL